MPPERPIAVVASDDASRPRAVALADALGLPAHAGGAPADPDGAAPAILLVVAPDRLELRDNAPRRKGEAPPGPVFIDVDALARLASQQPNYRQPLARALALDGLRRELGRAPHILDATGGLLHDAALLLSLGCRVSACERNPILAALIEDASQRGLYTAHPPGSFRFLPTDALNAIDTLSREDDPPDLVYFDPMHPARHGERATSALVRKELRILRAVVGDDDDSAQIILALLGRIARQSPPRTRRLVVKTPLRAGASGDLPAPVHSHRAKAVRYDVYSTFPTR